MESAYREWEKRRERPSGRRTATRHSAKVAFAPREQRRLLQLGVCVVLFLMVFIGKGIFPDQMVTLRDQISGAISGDTDFRAAFASLGKSISAGEPVMDTLGGLWVDVFGGANVTVETWKGLDTAITYDDERFALAEPATAETIMARDFNKLLPKQLPPQPEPVPTPAPTAVPTPTPAPAPTPVPAVEHMDYDGPALPANASMDKYALGLEKTVTPVLGWVSSSYGWREHPVDGEEKFHNGVDLAVNNGTKVQAFADGTVDFIGDSPDAYGLYTQITHANGVVSFYCHCSEILVQQGQTVKAGDIVALTGDTGNATGPHLHFELKKDGVRLNPLYYIETE